jgi:hypothetical protein
MKETKPGEAHATCNCSREGRKRPTLQAVQHDKLSNATGDCRRFTA